MKLLNLKAQPILAALLAVILVFGTMMVPGVFAQEKTDEGIASASNEQAGASVDDLDAASDASAPLQETAESPSDSELSAFEDAKADFADQAVSTFSSEPEDTEAQTADAAYSIQVTFDGKELSDDSSKNTVASWTSSTTKSAKVMLNKNSAAIEEGARYVLRMKTSQLFYFTGLPDKDKVTGIADVAMVQNDIPQVNLSTHKTSSLEKFSPYSGEIRVELNTVSETVTLTEIGICFDKRLVGYSGGNQTFKNPVSFEVSKCTDTGALKDLRDSDFVTVADTSRAVGSAEVATGSFASGGMKTTLSTDGYKTAGINMQNVVLGKGGSISYAGGTAGEDMQVYKTLTAVFHCPYIEVDGVKYYLSVDAASDVLRTNVLGKMTCFSMSQDAVYDSTQHTITYQFADIYLGGHTPFFVTPEFKFPEEFEGESVPDGGYKIYGGNWEITTQTCWSGATSSLRSTYQTPYYGTFLPDGVDVEMTSSNEADPSKSIAKRQICNQLTRLNGNEGALGFFDVHNDGATDSGDLTIKFEFNTDSADEARYYVTSVNLPTSEESLDNISFELANESGDVKQGVTTVPIKADSSRKGTCVNCKVSDLRKAAGASDDYYIKSVSYTTKLIAGKAYHIETAHLNRNRTNDGGLFFGYIEGDVGKTASASITISSTDGSAINKSNTASVSSTEVSTISADDYIGFGLRDMSLNGGDKTVRLTAGEGTSLSFGATVSTEEYRKSADALVVNGYHLFRDGIFYVALPEGVSILGGDQVKVRNQSGSEVKASEVEKLKGATFTEGDVTASWWKVTVPNINAWSEYFVASIDLATNLQMQGVSWNFKNHIVVQSGAQEASWSAASSNGSTYTSTKDLSASSCGTAANMLASYLKQQNGGKDVASGFGLYNGNSEAVMTIARAEAKLDVDTLLKVGDSSASDDASLYSADDAINYSVTVSSTDGGKAEDFSYYVPIVSASSAVDASAWTMKHEFGLKLEKAVSISRENESQSNDAPPFEVYYTTDPGLTADSVKDVTTWRKDFASESDSGAITAVKIVTTKDATINNNETYRFDFSLGFDDSESRFDTLAGYQVQWRTFGKYTYERNGATTTNTYPSGDNAITIKYRKDLTGSGALALKLNTGADSSKVNGQTNPVATFAKGQTLCVKSVKAPNGTKLVLDDDKTVQAYTGADANTKFSARFNINNLSAVNLGHDAPLGSWQIASGDSVTLMAEVLFSKALTDTATTRYVDIVVGNDDVDIMWRVNLVREVTPASLEGAGLAAGEKFQAFTSESNVAISQDSALSAQFKVDNFTPGNYADQTVGLFNKDGNAVSLPAGTSIIFMPLDADGVAESYWWYKASGSESSVSLASFKRMGGADSYSLDTSSTAATTLRYLFVVDFADDSSLSKDATYNLSFAASAKDGVTTGEVSSKVPFTVVGKSSFGLSATAQPAAASPSCEITYNVARSTGSESALEHKSLSLVLTPNDGVALPVDATMVADDGTTYAQNADGSFIIPIESIEVGAKSLSLHSALFPLANTVYSFEGQLYLSQSNVASAPMNGVPVGNELTVTFGKSEDATPSMSVTGTRVATVSQWAAGQDFTFKVSGVPVGGSVAVAAYSGMDGTQKVTDLLSSVGGVFDIKDGTGTYNDSNLRTDTLKLNGNASPGTYRLQFEVKDAKGNVVEQEPYCIIVRD